MIKVILSLVYVVGGFIVIFLGLSDIRGSIKKSNKDVKNHISDWMLALFAFMIVYAPSYWYYEIVLPRLPDGEYQIIASVRYTEQGDIYYFPADILTTNEKNYEEHSVYYGAYESTATETVYTRYIKILKIHETNGTDEFYDDVDVEQDKFVCVETKSGGNLWVNIGTITPERCGLSEGDRLQSVSAVSKIELAFIEIVCAAEISTWINDRKKNLQPA